MDERKVIVTIGRNFGSRGREVGMKLADKLDVTCYDRRILTESIKRNGMSEDLVREYDENPRDSFIKNMLESIREQGKKSQSFPTSYQLYLKQFEVIREIAQKESCVIVGRCADYVLKDREDVVKVFLSAPFDIRVMQIMERYGIHKEKAAEYIIKQDEIRKNYYDYYTKLSWGDKKNYDIILDTGELGVDNCVNKIMDYVKTR